MKHHGERVFGTFKWSSIKALPTERLQQGYVELKRRTGPTVSPESTEAPTERPAPSDETPSADQPSPALSPEQDAVRQEAVAAGIPDGEARDLLARYPLETARNVLHQGAKWRHPL